MTRKPHFLRTYTAVLAVVAGGSVAYAIDVSRAAASADQTAWKTEALRWHDLAQATIAHDRTVMAQNKQLVVRYRTVVRKANKNAKIKAAAVTAAASYVSSAPATAAAAAAPVAKTS
jgi:hypothetical protein